MGEMSVGEGCLVLPLPNSLVGAGPTPSAIFSSLSASLHNAPCRKCLGRKENEREGKKAK
jgi:hypothetical protein